MATNVRQQRGGVGPGAVITLFLHPHRGWRRIDGAAATVGSLIIGGAVPLAGLRAGVGLIHDLAYGRGSMGIIQYRPTTAGAIAAAIVSWLAGIVALIVLALAIAALAQRFGGRRDRTAAVKLAVIGSSPFFLASVFALVPVLAGFELLGVYALLLLALGAAALMRVPEERGAPFAGAALGLAALLAILLIVIDNAVARLSLQPTVKTAQGRRVVVTAPAISGVLLTAPANTKKGAQAPGTIAGTAGSIPASSLQPLLPAGFAGFQRTTVESHSTISAGVASADAKGTYVRGTDSVTLTITDAGQPGALATSNSVIAGDVNRVTDSGYQRSHLVNGVRVIEKWSNSDHGGSYSRTVAGRFTVEAQGTAPSIDTLRGAVASVDQVRLGALAH